ncbi:MAG: gamma-glutamyltransferase [Bacteroidota bacterium]
MKKLILTTLLLAVFMSPSSRLSAQEYARNGMVVSTSDVASEVGVAILKKGGNAIDAAVATAFALAVTHPSAGNIGGGGFIVYMDNAGKATTIDFREKAPLAATPDMFLDDNGELIFMENHLTAKAIGVPGTVAGLAMAHTKYGKLPWADLVQPAVDLAEGFPFNWTLYWAAKSFEENAERFPMMDKYFRNEAGEIVEPGDTWQQLELAETLKLIRDKGRDGFYKGKVAKGIETWMKENGGIITRKDLAKYEAVERTPVQGTYKDYTIYSMPPPSSGGTALIEMMNMMELVDFDSVEFNSTSYTHLVAEVMRRAFADRAEHLGDPDFNPEMPLDLLLSKAHAKKRFSSIDWSNASPSDSSRFGQLYGEGNSTTHFSVMDAEGNAVSLTYTLEFSYGSRMVAEDLGFIFNNEMGDFNPVPGVTTSRGQIGTNPNLIAPEKRMLSSMTPTIVAKDNEPYLVIGSPGGRTIINTVFQTVLAVLAYDMRIDKAIEAPKIHHQWLPDRIMYEPKVSPDTREALERMGHKMVSRETLGKLMGIVKDKERGVLVGASDSASGEGAAVGY